MGQKYWVFVFLTFVSCSSALPSDRQQSVFDYPKQRDTVLVGSVLKWRARPQCLRRQQSVFAYPKQRATVSVGSVLKWRARPQCLCRRRDFVLQMNNTLVCIKVALVCLHAIRCNIHEFCCNRLQGDVTLSYMSLHGYLATAVSSYNQMLSW
jgi:hypothetical protein